MRATIGLAVAAMSAVAVVLLVLPDSQPDRSGPDDGQTWTITIGADGHTLEAGWGPDGTHWKATTARSSLQTRHRNGDVWARWQDDGGDGGWVRVDGQVEDRSAPLRQLADDLLDGPTTVDVGQLYRQAGPPVRPDRGTWTLPSGQVTLTAEPADEGTWQATLPQEASRALLSDQAGPATITVTTGQLPDPPDDVPTVAAVDLPAHLTGGGGGTTRTVPHVAHEVAVAQAEHALQTGSFTADVGDLPLSRGPDVSVRLCTTSDGGRWAGWLDVFGDEPTFLSDDRGVVGDGSQLPCDPLQGPGASRAPEATAPSRSTP